MKLYSIENGYFKLDGGAMFGVVPRSLWSKVIPADENNLVRLAMRSLLIEAGGQLILVDTGIGNKQDERFLGHYHLHGDKSTDQSLASHGFSRNDITDVYLTHLHLDHAGGAVSKIDNELVPAFPNARYWTHRSQWEWAMNPNEREKASFLKENLLPLEERKVLHFIEPDDPGQFSGVLTTRLSSGHTESMMMPFVRYKNRTIVFVADLFPTTAHIPVAYVPAYDVRPLQTMKEKTSFLNEALENEYILFFGHDADVECCTLKMTEKGIRAEKKFALSEIS